MYLCFTVSRRASSTGAVGSSLVTQAVEWIVCDQSAPFNDENLQVYVHSKLLIADDDLALVGVS